VSAALATTRREPLIEPRALGAAVGCVIALACALVTGSEFMGMGLPVDGVALVSTIAPGSGGWLLGPRAARATRVSHWVGVSVGLAFVTMVMGAVGVALLAGVSGGNTLSGGAGEFLIGVVALSLMGMLFFGWIAVPILLVPAAAWSVLMRVKLGRR
jgi:hypothetical protein